MRPYTLLLLFFVSPTFIWTQQSNSFPPQLIQWVKKNAYPISQSDPKSYDELSFLDPILDKYTMILLGEGTHGTKEIFQIKDKIARYLFSSGKISKLGIEYDLVNGFKMNEYVHGDFPDLYEALNEQRGWVWNTEEIAALVGWMKDFNQNGGAIDYFGIDVFRLIESAYEATLFLDEYQVTDLQVFKKQWRDLFSKDLAYFVSNEDEFYEVLSNSGPLSQNYRVQEMLHLLVDLFDQNKSELISKSSLKTWMIKRQLAETALIRSQHLLQFNMNYIFTQEDWQEEWQFYRTFGKKADSLNHYLAKLQDPYLQKSIGEILAKVSNPYKGRSYYLKEMSFQQRSDWKDQVQSALQRIMVRRPFYSEKLMLTELSSLESHLSDLNKLLKLYQGNFDKPLERLNAREIGLAQNAAFLNTLDDKGTLIWAHNLHVTKIQTNARNDGDKMGTFLKQKFGDQMVVIGTFVGSGTLQAWEYEGNKRKLTVFELDQPKQGSLEDLFSQAGCDICLLDLSQMPENGTVKDWFSQKQLFRSIGNYYDQTAPEEFYKNEVIGDHFDLLIFINKTNRAEPTEYVKQKYFKEE